MNALVIALLQLQCDSTISVTGGWWVTEGTHFVMWVGFLKKTFRCELKAFTLYQSFELIAYVFTEKNWVQIPVGNWKEKKEKKKDII